MPHPFHTARVSFACTCTVLAGWICLLQGCTTNPPITPDNPVPATGKILVLANVADAIILLDGASTGKVTPDTLTATVGSHVVAVQKAGFLTDERPVLVAEDSLTEVAFTLTEASQRVVLIEDFSNVSCNPCVTSNLILDALANGTYSRSKVAVVKYATNFPSPSDPFYTGSRTDCDARMSYYQILASPTTIVGGVDRPPSTDSSAIKSAIDVALMQPARFMIDVTDGVAAGLYSITVTVRTLDTAGLDWQHLVLHTVVTEAEIIYSSPPGSNGETRFTDIMRAMLPSKTGEPLHPDGAGGTMQYSRSIPISQAWRSDQLHSVAFIQHTQTRVVYQSGSTFE
jgi:hypothetical protein